ncbi:WhiB family transcriptional regulator [Intrasporangium sp.]|uniref:WhiB family transcriptional regulator n=1 Tax=Intrasporangium sp. TaxID=1925024 RepID=UPI003221BCBB
MWLREYGVPVKGLNPAGGPSVATLSRPGWKTTGSCVGANAELWFSEPRTGRAHRAAAICAACPIRELCLAAALVFDEEYGIWGGLTPAGRRPFVARLQAGQPLGIVLADALDQAGDVVAA